MLSELVHAIEQSPLDDATIASLARRLVHMASMAQFAISLMFLTRDERATLSNAIVDKCVIDGDLQKKLRQVLK
jgi:hypothetical protein